MATCAWCSARGFFQKVSTNHLCGRCEAIVVPDILQRIRRFEESERLVRESENLETRTSRCALIVEDMEVLARYEARGVPTVRPLPSDLVVRFRRLHRQLLNSPAYWGIQTLTLHGVVAVLDEALRRNAVLLSTGMKASGFKATDYDRFIATGRHAAIAHALWGARRELDTRESRPFTGEPVAVASGQGLQEVALSGNAEGDAPASATLGGADSVKNLTGIDVRMVAFGLTRAGEVIAGISEEQRIAFRRIVALCFAGGLGEEDASSAAADALACEFLCAKRAVHGEIERASKARSLEDYGRRGVKKVLWRAREDEQGCGKCRRRDGRVMTLRAASEALAASYCLAKTWTRTGEFYDCCRCSFEPVEVNDPAPS